MTLTNRIRTMAVLLLLAGAPASPALAGPSGQARAEADQEAAESLYDEGHDALDEDDNRLAARLFGEIARRYPNSEFAGEALYWQAFALLRLGGTADLKKAREALDLQAKKYPDADTRRDSEALSARVDGALARAGDAGASARVAKRGKSIGDEPGTPSPDEVDAEVQMAALQALITMDPDRALPILKRLLARRDPASAELREQAVFLVAQKQTPESEAILIDLLKNDPDPKVREQAVFWLSSIPSESALDAIITALKTTPSEEVQDNAVFALSRHESPRARQALRDLALDPKVDDHIREQAVFWIAQSGAGDSIDFLKKIYDSTDDEEIKNQVLFGIARQESPGAKEWLLGIVRRPSEPVEARKTALFWLGQNGRLSLGELDGIYRASDDLEMREQVIFVLSQQHSKEAVDVLMTIARKDPDPEMRKQAIFWLGQSDDPRAAELLERLVGE